MANRIQELLFECSVPSDERQLIDDTPKAYCILREGPCVCIVYGRYHGWWRRTMKTNTSKH